MTEDTIRDLLIEIKTKVDILVTQHGDHETRLRAVEQRPSVDPTATLTDHETRIRALERARWLLVGAAAAAGGLAGKLAGLL